MPQEPDSMERFDKIMRALVAVSKKEAIKNMKEKIAQKRRSRVQRRKRD